MKLNHVQMPTVEELKSEVEFIRRFPEIARLGLIDESLESNWFRERLSKDLSGSRQHFDHANRMFRACFLRMLLSFLGIFSGVVVLSICLFWILAIRIEDTTTLMRIGITLTVFILFCCAFALFGDARTYMRESRQHNKIAQDFLIDWIRYCEILQKSSPRYEYDADKITKLLVLLEDKRAKLQQRLNDKIENDEADISTQPEIRAELMKTRDELYSASELFQRFGFEEANVQRISLIALQRREAQNALTQNTSA